MSDNLGDKTALLRMNKKIKKFMNLTCPWILKQRFPTFSTVISVAENDVEIVYE